jgi:CubicO group peptidase (beta-lactamase class C family)
MILLQVEQGKLNVTDKVSKYLKEFQIKEYENITIHQLLNHTSGLNMMGGKLMFKAGQISSTLMTDLMHWVK